MVFRLFLVLPFFNAVMLALSTRRLDRAGIILGAIGMLISANLPIWIGSYYAPLLDFTPYLVAFIICTLIFIVSGGITAWSRRPNPAVLSSIDGIPSRIRSRRSQAAAYIQEPDFLKPVRRRKPLKKRRHQV